MKKLIAACCLICLLLTGCDGHAKPEILGLNNNYRDQYAFYDYNIGKIESSMGLDGLQADAAFACLLDIGVDAEISNVLKVDDGYGRTYYRIWWGEDFSASIEAYLSDGEIVKICKGDDVLFDRNDDTAVDSSAIAVDAPPDTTEKPDTQAPVTTGEITLQSVTSPVTPGSTATVEAICVPGTEYTISVIYSSGASSAAGLEPKTAGEDGLVSWSWRVGSKTADGTYQIVISGGGTALETSFTVAKD